MTSAERLEVAIGNMSMMLYLKCFIFDAFET